MKGSSRPWQSFLKPNPEAQSISGLSVGKMLTVHHHEIEKKFPYDGFEINSERDIKIVFQNGY